jgi:hypothetical protein
MYKKTLNNQENIIQVGKSPLKERTHHVGSSSSSGLSNGHTVHHREKTSIKLLNTPLENKSILKQKRALAKERWHILKNAIINKNSSYYKSKMSVRRFDSFGLIKSIKIAYSTPSVQINNIDHRSKKNNTNNNNKHAYRNSNHNNNDSDDSDENDVYIAGKSPVKARSSSRTKFHRDGSIDRNNNRNSSQSKQQTDAIQHFQWYAMSVPSVDSSFSVKVRFLNGPTDLKNLVGFNNTGNICLWPSEEIMTYFCVKNSSIFDNKSVCELGGGMTCLAGLMISKCSQPKEVFLTDGNEASFES